MTKRRLQSGKLNYKKYSVSNMDDSIKKIRIMKLWELLNRETDEDNPLTTEQILSKLEDMEEDRGSKHG